jgi:MFS family permease
MRVFRLTASSIVFIALIIGSVMSFVQSNTNHFSKTKNMAVKPHDIRSGASRIHPVMTVTPRSQTAVVNEAVASSTQHPILIIKESSISLDSTASTDALATTTASSPPSRWLNQKIQGMFTINRLVCTAYLCNILALSLPVILVPLAAQEQLGKHASSLVTSQVANIMSVAAIGGAGGKFVNGFVCQQMGTYRCSKVYLAGVALSSLVFSMSTSTAALGAAFASVEFFASVQCASLAVMLTNYYKNSPAKLAAALCAMGLSSTIGEILAKILGTTLTSAFHWRKVAQIGSIIALVGALAISKAPRPQQAATQSKIVDLYFQWSSIKASLKAVLGSDLFWKLSLAYSMAFVACCTDRLLGPFYHSVSEFSHEICGGLTMSVTLGLIHGLVSASKRLVQLPTLQAKTTFFSRRYIRSISATLGLTGLAYFGSALPKTVAAVAVALLSFTMASNVAFQCYQFPAMIAQKFGDHQAVCISFLDGFGYLLSVPLYAVLGQLVPKFGWASGWLMLSILFALGGIMMMKAIPPILDVNTSDDTVMEKKDL